MVKLDGRPGAGTDRRRGPASESPTYGRGGHDHGQSRRGDGHEWRQIAAQGGSGKSQYRESDKDGAQAPGSRQPAEGTAQAFMGDLHRSTSPSYTLVLQRHNSTHKKQVSSPIFLLTVNVSALSIVW